MSWFLDGLAFLYMLLNGTLGFTRGLVDELGRLIGLVISILVAISQTVNISNLIIDKIDLEPWLAVFIGFSSIFAVILISSRLITRLFQIALLSKANIWLNSLLGFLFGMLKGFCIITVFVWLLIIDFNCRRWRRIGSHKFTIRTMKTIKYDDQTNFP